VVAAANDRTTLTCIVPSTTLRVLSVYRLKVPNSVADVATVVGIVIGAEATSNSLLVDSPKNAAVLSYAFTTVEVYGADCPATMTVPEMVSVCVSAVIPLNVPFVPALSVKVPVPVNEFEVPLAMAVPDKLTLTLEPLFTRAAVAA
jgi:hypothetical protein